MTQTASRIQSKATAAMRRVESYRKRFGDSHIYLACYAALPLALTPDLLYRLWANFQRDMEGELLEIPWIAVSDLLLSNLCEEVGEELYEMEDGVRAVLLKELRSRSQLGETRLKEVAEFVLAYVEPQLNNPDSDVRDLAEVQQWRSLAYVQPEAAARSIALRLAELDHGDKSEWLRMAQLVEPLAEPLVEFAPLVDYMRGMAAFVRGRREEAISQLRRALGEKREVEVAGVRLPLPEGLRSLLQPERPKVKSTKLSWVDFLLRNRRWVGSGAGLLVMVGSGVYWWRFQKPRSIPVSENPPSNIAPSASIAVPSPTTSPTNSANLTPSVTLSGSVAVPNPTTSPTNSANLMPSVTLSESVAVTSPTTSPTNSASPPSNIAPSASIAVPNPTISPTNPTNLTPSVMPSASVAVTSPTTSPTNSASPPSNIAPSASIAVPSPTTSPTNSMPVSSESGQIPSTLLPPNLPPTDTTSGKANQSTQALEIEVKNLINTYRKNQGLEPLILDPLLSAQARQHSQDMADGLIPFGHDGFQDRVTASNIGYGGAAENVAYNQGYTRPSTVAVEAWLRSSGHKTNIEGNYNLTGIGVAKNVQGRIYYTQMFLRTR
jgi:uncharacterized protein YkwD